MQEGVLDVLVIGGGINGAGVARDLALRSKIAGRGLRVGLVEKGQFGSGTSGRNSHLIHGGLRYLKYFDIRLVREALRERATLLHIAPHLVEPLPLILPFESRWTQLYYGAGLWLYDRLAGDKQIARHRHIARGAIGDLEPSLQSHFAGAAVYYDCRMQAARLVLENVWDALAHGAIAANYLRMLDQPRQDGTGWTVPLHDEITGKDLSVRTQRLVDATGAWMKSESVRLVRGSHLILPRLNSSENAVAYFEPDGRIVFFIPWGTGEEFTLVGTTDIDHEGAPDRVRISPQETAYLLRVTRRVFRKEVIAEPLSAFSSLRPLVREEGRSATTTSREHRIWKEPGEVVRITGGKYTTYRSMSEEAVDLLFPEFARLHATGDWALSGNTPSAFQQLLDSVPQLSAKYGLPEAEIRFLVRNYGVHVELLLSYFGSEAAAAPIAYAANHEMAQKLVDVLFISTTWGYEHHWDAAAMRAYAESLGRHLGWDAKRIELEAEEALQFCSDTAPANLSEVASTSAT